MPQISLTIDGRSYRMACGEGEETHIAELAADLGRRLGEMRGQFGAIGDMRLQVMAALTLADELHEARARLAALEAEASSLRAAARSAQAARALDARRAAAGIGGAAERLGRLADALDRAPRA